MATIYSVRTGDWFNPSTWDSNSVPTSSDDVILNHPVRANSNITVGSIINLTTGGGELIISTNLTITCTGTGIAGNKVLLISPKTINSPLIQNVGNITISSLLLDEYPNASAAYSLRKISNTYTGSAVRVRRSSDNTESDIGFVNNNLDTTTLTTFCSGTNGFVTRWYDQSGTNNNATQVSASLQPQIVSAGSLYLSNGKPSIFLGDTKGLVFNTPFTPISTFTVAKINTLGNSLNYILFNASATQGYYYGGTITTGIGVFDGSAKSITGQDTNIHLAFYNYTGASFQIGKDGSTLTNLSNGPNITLQSIGRLTLNLNLNGPLQEIICYSSNQSSNRIGIESNINSYYNIY